MTNKKSRGHRPMTPAQERLLGLIKAAGAYGRACWDNEREFLSIRGLEKRGLILLEDVEEDPEGVIEYRAYNRSWVCRGCSRVRPWSDGAADDKPNLCDDCWAKHHGVTDVA